jgi:hypothetical protein
MQPRGHRRKPNTRRPASTLTIRAAFEMAEFEMRREAAIYEMAVTASAQQRSRELHARANELRLRRSMLP